MVGTSIQSYDCSSGDILELEHDGMKLLRGSTDRIEGERKSEVAEHVVG